MRIVAAIAIATVAAGADGSTCTHACCGMVVALTAVVVMVVANMCARCVRMVAAQCFSITPALSLHKNFDIASVG